MTSSKEELQYYLDSLEIVLKMYKTCYNAFSNIDYGEDINDSGKQYFTMIELGMYAVVKGLEGLRDLLKQAVDAEGAKA